MSKTQLMLLCVVPILALSVLTHVIAQDDSADSPPKPAKQELRQSLLGAWVLLGEPGTNEEPKAGARMKFWGRGHWLITQADPETGEVIFHHGGTYTLEGDKYEETITFATEPTKQLIGQTLRFKIAVKGNRYTQSATSVRRLVECCRQTLSTSHRRAFCNSAARFDAARRRFGAHRLA